MRQSAGCFTACHHSRITNGESTRQKLTTRAAQCCYMPFWHRVRYVTIEVLRVEVQIMNDLKYSCGYKNESRLHIENGLESETPEL